ncbi:pitrilysin family protein [Stappia sp. ES.058]|uniref:M16 family metallopeptidase n=1 Tax=Stappia sp. ES.058 TaxID=1881061 RepID=UPI00087A6E37|nr:zinc protease [Stappia sp. ES.058]
MPQTASALPRVFLAAAVALALAAPARASSDLPAGSTTLEAADAASFADIKIGGDVESFRLDNGLEVVVIPDRRAPVVTHMIWYRVGAADEEAGMSGVAHFLEHLMFKGTEKNPDGAFSKRVAAIGGQENAFTSNDYTAYFQRVAKEHLPEMMALEADRMENLILTDEVVAPERDVVLEERRMRVDNDPGAMLGETLDAVLYVNHPYGTPVIGWPSEISALSKDNAIAFYDRFYTPNNAILIVAGDVDVDGVRRMAEETYGKVAQRADPGERVRPAAQRVPGSLEVDLADPRVNQPNLRKAWLVPSYTTDKADSAPALDILSEILGGGSTSRLYRSLVIDQGVASSAGGWYQSSTLDDSRFMVYAVPSDGTSLEDLGAATRAVIDTLIADGVTEAELERAKTGLLSSALYAQDSQSSLARMFGVALTTGSSIDEVRGWPGAISAVTPEDVRKAAETYLAPRPVTAYLRAPSVDAGANAQQ